MALEFEIHTLAWHFSDFLYVPLTLPFTSIKISYFVFPVDFDPDNFWNWTHFKDYIQFIGLFVLVFGSVTYALMNVKIYLETLGFVSVFTEAMLGAPQFYRNYKNKSTEGMR